MRLFWENFEKRIWVTFIFMPNSCTFSIISELSLGCTISKNHDSHNYVANGNRFLTPYFSVSRSFNNIAPEAWKRNKRKCQSWIMVEGLFTDRLVSSLCVKKTVKERIMKVYKQFNFSCKTYKGPYCGRLGKIFIAV